MKPYLRSFIVLYLIIIVIHLQIFTRYATTRSLFLNLALGLVYTPTILLNRVVLGFPPPSTWVSTWVIYILGALQWLPLALIWNLSPKIQSIFGKNFTPSKIIMLIFLALSPLLAFCYFTLPHMFINVQGTVIDKSTHQPISNAKVFVNSESATMTYMSDTAYGQSNEQGEFDLGTLNTENSRGLWFCSSHPDYITETSSIKIIDLEKRQIKISLQPFVSEIILKGETPVCDNVGTTNIKYFTIKDSNLLATNDESEADIAFIFSGPVVRTNENAEELLDTNDFGCYPGFKKDKSIWKLESIRTYDRGGITPLLSTEHTAQSNYYAHAALPNPTTLTYQSEYKLPQGEDIKKLLSNESNYDALSFIIRNRQATQYIAITIRHKMSRIRWLISNDSTFPHNPKTKQVPCPTTVSEINEFRRQISVD